jgi:hypothetical protein
MLHPNDVLSVYDSCGRRSLGMNQSIKCAQLRPAASSLSEKVVAGVPPAVEAGILPCGKNCLIGRNGWFYQADGAATLLPPSGTHRLYVSQAGRRYHFQTRSWTVDHGAGRGHLAETLSSSQSSSDSLCHGPVCLRDERTLVPLQRTQFHDQRTFLNDERMFFNDQISFIGHQRSLRVPRFDGQKIG